ncbi:MAG: HDIG domain-containing protein [Candidatus Moranbacteria bacterium]|nr:HDIG domain-containing protein [Candidatus Moranbacteria bacterium]
MSEKSFSIPLAVSAVLKTLSDTGFQAFVVGGCVRDVLSGTKPKDWDVTTNATPEQTQELFPDSFYENRFGTVGVKTLPFLDGGKEDRGHDVIEVTTFRNESGYSDTRRPDTVTFVNAVEEDLARRDFTMNAIALSFSNSFLSTLSNDVMTVSGWTTVLSSDFSIVDPFSGQADIDAKVIRAVGNPDERFSEDALRMMRAVRFAAQLGFVIGEKTSASILKHSELLKKIAAERVRDELSKIILSPEPSSGIRAMEKLGLLQHVIPELMEGIGVMQNLHHTYSVYDHNLRALDMCPSKKLTVKLAALFHDIAKPRTKRGNGKRSTFYNHEHLGARMTRKRLELLHYPKDIVEKVTLLVDSHMFYYNVNEVTESSVRRLIKKVGLENMRDLVQLRIGDRLGSGVPKAKPYRLRHFEYMVEKVSKDPVSVKMLKLNGDIMIKDLGFSPGPKIGAILDTLLAEVIEDPLKNTLEHLSLRAKELDEHDLSSLRALAKKRIEEQRAHDEASIKKKHHVQ